jgi:hypothetical protein
MISSVGSRLRSGPVLGSGCGTASTSCHLITRNLALRSVFLRCARPPRHSEEYAERADNTCAYSIASLTIQTKGAARRTDVLHAMSTYLSGNREDNPLRNQALHICPEAYVAYGS